MMTPQQAFHLFVYADWAMLFAAFVAISITISFSVYAILPRNKGRRWPILRKALISLLAVALYVGTQTSVAILLGIEHKSLPMTFAILLPVAGMLGGLIASIACGIIAIWRKTGIQRRQTVLKSLLGIVVFGLGIAPHTIAMLMPVLSVEDHSDSPGTLTRVGETVPDFRLASVEGKPFRAVDLRGKVIVLSFFATWCGPCQKELPQLQAIWDEFHNDSDFRMLVVGREESDDSVKTYRQKHGFSFPLASDRDKSVYAKFASQYIPRTYLISREGTIVYQSAGYYEAETAKLKNLLRRELAKTE